MAEIVTFDFDTNAVRVLMRDDAPWFVLADVCRVLEIVNPSQAASRLDDDERDTLINNEGIADARVQSFAIINESGLYYSLILTSRKPEAKRFRKWVTADVLPSIRRTGRYEGAPAPIDAAACLTLPPLDDLRAQLDLCRFVERTRGKRIALRLYGDLRLPGHDYIAAPDAVAVPLLGLISRELPVRDFIAERLMSVPDGRVSASAMLTAWIRWCREREINPGTQAAFGRAMTAAGVVKTKSGVVQYCDVQLAGTERLAA